MSDSARFKPFRERIDASFTVNSQSGIFGVAEPRIRASGAPEEPTDRTGRGESGRRDGQSCRFDSGGGHILEEPPVRCSGNAGLAGNADLQLDAPASADGRWQLR